MRAWVSPAGFWWRHRVSRRVGTDASDGVVGLHEVRAEYVGPDLVHAYMHLEVARGTAVEEMDRINEKVRRRVHDETDTGYCVIQIQAAGSPAAHETTGERVDSLAS